jgi:hypothetical protein
MGRQATEEGSRQLTAGSSSLVAAFHCSAREYRFVIPIRNYIIATEYRLGLFIFAWTSMGPPIPWAAPLVGAFLIAIANVSSYLIPCRRWLDLGS